MDFEQLKSEYIQAIYKTKALIIQENPFTLQSGKQSHIYLNHRKFLSHHSYLRLMAQIYHQLSLSIPGNYVLSTVDSIMSPILVGAMSALFNLDTVAIQKQSLSHGTKECLYGALKQNTVLIDDMTSTGETLIDASHKIRASGGVVNYAIISAYREHTASDNLQEQGIKLLSIASFAEILHHLAPTLTPQEKQIINQKPLIFA